MDTMTIEEFQKLPDIEPKVIQINLTDTPLADFTKTSKPVLDKKQE